MTPKARTEFFTVILLPEKLTTIASRTRYIPWYITQLHRKAQSADGGELADTGHCNEGRLQDDLHGFAFDIMSPGGLSMAAPVVRFRIDFAKHSSVGPGKIRLLEAIRDCGSLSQGARNIGMSYRRAWLLVESLKQSFREPVTVASTGGKDGGGMLVTEFGEALIKNYRELERDFETLAARRLHAVIPTAIRHSKSDARTSIRTKLE